MARALVAYLAAGYPDFREQEKMILAMQENGVDILELGVPFSDPIADGPTIQFASQQSLDHGTTLSGIIKWVGRLRKRVHIPIVLMSYMNPIDAYGAKRFAQDAKRVGIQGLIVPDLIPEESNELRRILATGNVSLIHLVAPTTPKERQLKIAKLTRGFLYAVSVRGVTGARRKLPKETKGWLNALRKKSPAPVYVGFGISGPEQMRELRSAVDGFIVGSAFIDIIRKNKKSERLSKITAFVKRLKKECI